MLLWVRVAAVGTNLGGDAVLLGVWVTLGYGTVLKFAELHAELVVASPSLAGVGAALQAVLTGYTIVTDV